MLPAKWAWLQCVGHGVGFPIDNSIAFMKNSACSLHAKSAICQLPNSASPFSFTTRQPMYGFSIIFNLYLLISLILSLIMVGALHSGDKRRAPILSARHLMAAVSPSCHALFDDVNVQSCYWFGLSLAGDIQLLWHIPWFPVSTSCVLMAEEWRHTPLRVFFIPHQYLNTKCKTIYAPPNHNSIANAPIKMQTFLGVILTPFHSWFGLYCNIYQNLSQIIL